MAIKLFLVCSLCPVRHANFITSKGKKTKDKKLLLRKYCRFCRKTQVHTEEALKKKTN